jgi:phosphatidate cytidylyltransferase
MFSRLFTASLLAGGFLLALFGLTDTGWALLMLGIITLASWEWGGLAGLFSWQRWFYSGMVMATGLLLLPGAPGAVINGVYHHALFWNILAAVPFWLILVPFWLLFHLRISYKPLMVVIGGLILLAAWLSVLALRRIDPWLLLIVMAAVWIADSAAYFAGRAFGRHKLAPEISPGKTWEGVAGALLAVTLYGLLLSMVLHLSPWVLVGLWALTVMSIIGDLFESLLKRQAGLKDSGNILPGHGGLLDRIDGLLPTLPLATFYVHFPLYYYALFHE